jgi:hypothetical protein
MDKMLSVAGSGIRELIALQQKTLLEEVPL